MTLHSDATRDDSTRPMFLFRSNPGASEQPHQFTPLLICIEGPQRGTRFPLTTSESVIGRSSSATIVLNDDMASRRHVRILYPNSYRSLEYPECYVEDMESRNGTELNGTPLKVRTRLGERDRILIGTTLLGFFLRDEGEAEHDHLLYEMATRDALTNLDNRHQFKTHLLHHIERARRDARPISMLVIDADRFKRVNDTRGHDIGDRALVHIARMIQSCCRVTEIIARWGGEEFVVLLPETGYEGAMRVAERIRTAIESTPLSLQSGMLSLTVSIGGAELEASDDLNTLFHRADQQLLKAKEAGRNHVRFEHKVQR